MAANFGKSFASAAAREGPEINHQGTFAMPMSVISTLSILTIATLFNGSLLALLALYIYKHRKANPIVR